MKTPQSTRQLVLVLSFLADSGRAGHRADGHRMAA